LSALLKPHGCTFTRFRRVKDDVRNSFYADNACLGWLPPK
jgi:hypothetical protein